MMRPCAGCPRVDDLPRIAVQSDDGRQWFDFHFACATETAIAAARSGNALPIPALNEEPPTCQH